MHALLSHGVLESSLLASGGISSHEGARETETGSRAPARSVTYRGAAVGLVACPGMAAERPSGDACSTAGVGGMGAPGLLCSQFYYDAAVVSSNIIIFKKKEVGDGEQGWGSSSNFINDQFAKLHDPCPLVLLTLI